MDLKRELTNRYFLGTATDAEDEEIGVRVIENESFAEKMIQAENDLIEDYLEGSLSAADIDLFEREYLVSEERRERVQEIVLLKKYATRSAEMAVVVEPVVASVPWYQNFKILVPAFSVVILLGVASLFFLDRGTVGGVDYAQLNRGDLRDSAIIGDAQVVQITPGTYRSGPAGVTVVIGSSASVLFRLPLTFSVDAGASYDASIERDGRKVFNVSQARVYTEGAVSEVRLLAPRESLPPGTYQIRLTQTGASNAPVLYTFEVR